MWLRRELETKGKKLAKALMAAVLGMVLIIAGCSSGSNSSADTAAYSGGAGNSSSSTASAQYNATALNRAATDNAKTTDSDAGAGAGFDSAAAPINRMVVYNAYVIMEVDDFAAVQTEIRNLVQLSGGYLLEFSENRSEYERGGSFVIKVPSSGFMSFLERLEEISPDRFDSNITGEDVTEEYVDLDARLHALEVTESRLLAFMEKATTAGELVEFSRELSNVQQEIERIKGRMRYLEQNVAYSTIEVRIYELEDGVSKIQKKHAPFGERLTTSLYMVLNGISDFLQELAIFVISAIPVVVVIAVFASPFFLLWYRHRKKQRKEEGEWAARLQPRQPGLEQQQTGEEQPGDHRASRATRNSDAADQQDDELNRNGDQE